MHWKVSGGRSGRLLSCKDLMVVKSAVEDCIQHTGFQSLLMLEKSLCCMHCLSVASGFFTTVFNYWFHLMVVIPL